MDKILSDYFYQEALQISLNLFQQSVGIDIAKILFQVCVLSTDGKVIPSLKVKRDKLIDTVRQLP